MLLLTRLTRFGGLGNDAKKFLRRMKAIALARGGGKILHALWRERML